MDEKKIKHLEMIMTVIDRMGIYSFLLKGWSVTLVVGIFALTSKDVPKVYISLTFFPAILFWVLDAFYLWQERMFRSLYEYVRKRNEDKIDFSMDVSKVSDKKIYGESNTWKNAAFSRTTLLFHGSTLMAILIFVIILIYS